MSQEVDGQQAEDPADEAGQALWNEIAREEDEGPPATPGSDDQATNEGTEGAGEQVAKPTGEAASQPAPQGDDVVQALRKQVEELTGLVKSSAGRIGALQSRLDKQGEAAQAPSHQQVAAAAKSTEKWNVLKKDFPEWGDAVEELVSANLQPAVKLDELAVQAAARAREEAVSATHVSTAKQLATFAEPDWEAVIGSDQFDQWLTKQPADYVAQAAEASAQWDAYKVVSIVRDFKKATQTPPQQTRGASKGSQSRLASAAVPSGSQATRKAVESLEGEAYWKQLEHEDRQSRRA